MEAGYLKRQFVYTNSTSTQDEQPQQQTPNKSALAASTVPQTPDGTLRFTDVVNNLQNVYPKQQMEDISTSYCFICLLHLANEKGLVIENQPGWEELSIRKDLTAEPIPGEA